MSVLSVIDGTNIVIILEDMLLSAQVRMKICDWNKYYDTEKRGELVIINFTNVFRPASGN